MAYTNKYTTAIRVRRLLEVYSSLPTAITTAIIEEYIKEASQYFDNETGTTYSDESTGNTPPIVARVVTWIAAHWVNTEAAAARGDKATESQYWDRATEVLTQIKRKPGGVAANRPLRFATQLHDYRTQREVDDGTPVILGDY